MIRILNQAWIHWKILSNYINSILILDLKSHAARFVSEQQMILKIKNDDGFQ